MARAFETDTTITEWHGTSQVDTALVEGNPIRAIGIFYHRFRIQLICKIAAAQQKLGILGQVHHIGLRALPVENASLIQFEIIRRDSRKIRFLANIQSTTELTCKVRIQYIQ